MPEEQQEHAHQQQAEARIVAQEPPALRPAAPLPPGASSRRAGEAERRGPSEWRQGRGSRAARCAGRRAAEAHWPAGPSGRSRWTRRRGRCLNSGACPSPAAIPRALTNDGRRLRAMQQATENAAVRSGSFCRREKGRAAKQHQPAGQQRQADRRGASGRIRRPEAAAARSLPPSCRRAAARWRCRAFHPGGYRCA